MLPFYSENCLIFLHKILLLLTGSSVFVDSNRFKLFKKCFGLIWLTKDSSIHSDLSAGYWLLKLHVLGDNLIWLLFWKMSCKIALTIKICWANQCTPGAWHWWLTCKYQHPLILNVCFSMHVQTNQCVFFHSKCAQSPLITDRTN